MQPLSGNQRPDLLTALMNMSLVIAPATENASLQILFNCPTPAIVFGNATKPSRFAHFWQGAQSLAPAPRNGTWTSKVVRACGVFNILTSKCASRHNGVHFLTSQLPKVFKHGVFGTFWLGNVLPPRRALFRHLNFQKWSEALYILTSKCASRHNGVHFFDISIPKVVCSHFGSRVYCSQFAPNSICVLSNVDKTGTCIVPE